MHNQNLIHACNKELKRKQKRDVLAVFPEQALEGIVALVLEKPKLLTDPDTDDFVPLIAALKLDASVLTRVLDLLVPVPALDHLKTANGRCQGSEKDCPLSTISPQRLGRCRNPQKTNDAGPVGRGDLTGAPHSGVDIVALEKEDKELR